MAIKKGTFAGVGKDFERRGYEEQPHPERVTCHVCGTQTSKPMFATKCPKEHCKKCVVNRECPNLENE